MDRVIREAFDGNLCGENHKSPIRQDDVSSLGKPRAGCRFPMHLSL
jgi:hypothetical protein